MINEVIISGKTLCLGAHRSENKHDNHVLGVTNVLENIKTNLDVYYVCTELSIFVYTIKCKSIRNLICFLNHMNTEFLKNSLGALMSFFLRVIKTSADHTSWVLCFAQQNGLTHNYDYSVTGVIFHNSATIEMSKA